MAEGAILALEPDRLLRMLDAFDTARDPREPDLEPWLAADRQAAGPEYASPCAVPPKTLAIAERLAVARVSGAHTRRRREVRHSGD